VLVLDAAEGGVATAWMLREMNARGVVPAALVLNAVNPIMVQGAAFAGSILSAQGDQLGLPLIPPALITVATRIFDVLIVRHSPPRGGPNVPTSSQFNTYP
jgi:predicted aconitase with swiveling domain